VTIINGYKVYRKAIGESSNTISGAALLPQAQNPPAYEGNKRILCMSGRNRTTTFPVLKLLQTQKTPSPQRKLGVFVPDSKERWSPSKTTD
jgi:hypothetical protein